MNYKKIAKFIKDARHLTIWNDGSLQYISDGVAVYPVFGMPKMNEMEMLNFLGLMDKSSAISTVMKPAPEFLKNASYDECSDSILEKTGPLIINRGEVYRSFYTESGASGIYSPTGRACRRNQGKSKAGIYKNMSKSHR